ncbi:1,2-dihydroxy-3-keto-5-methylthiopentene dioxygenase [Tulasnella sp. 330]|nr:1,2-dihydroxy-3-keto-5-methylthiopentene dioxygenase [Tulasnella sp. 330]KAG8872026.1 1,2-dihydroxy-3-keto-5-methylthiopentene dioxygenase [Tulasnella sp. 331]KAG8875329.1 1,2-dihydroxy-3-keto-5-methylthiopentene dioxygenase [Tulasnella sp. 332]
MRAYYYDNKQTDQRLPHECNPPEPVDLADLKKIGVLHWRIPIDEVAAEKEYKNRDIINVSRTGLGDAYEGKIKGFFEEHMHEDEEIRYILSGGGYFDVRETPNDRWIRIACVPGDLLVLPAGIYHRFTLDTSDATQAMRLFKDEPKWTPLNRGPETDSNIHRIEYLRSVGAAA